jgi:hypothetical protein
MEYVGWRARCPLGKPRGIGLYQSKGPCKRPWKEETLRADWHQPTKRKLCFNIQQWKTTSCLPYKPCVGWFLDFVITSWSEFLKIFTFKVLSQGDCLISPYFGNDLNLGLYPTLKHTISLKFEAQGPKVPPHQIWKYHMLEIHEFSSHATVHTTTTQYIPTGSTKMKNGVQGGFKNWAITSDTHTHFEKAFQSVEERICWRKAPSNCTTQIRCMIHNKPLFYNHTLGDDFFCFT